MYRGQELPGTYPPEREITILCNELFQIVTLGREFIFTRTRIVYRHIVKISCSFSPIKTIIENHFDHIFTRDIKLQRYEGQLENKYYGVVIS